MTVGLFDELAEEGVAARRAEKFRSMTFSMLQLGRAPVEALP